MTAPLLLKGTWSATRWRHTSVQPPERSLDVIADLRGSVMLTLGHGAYVLTCDMARRGLVNVGGLFTVRGDVLELRTAEDGESERMRWVVRDDDLMLSSDASRCDFDGEGAEEHATFLACFRRLGPAPA